MQEEVSAFCSQDFEREHIRVFVGHESENGFVRPGEETALLAKDSF